MTRDWSISGGIEPLFWLGDRIKLHPQNARHLGYADPEQRRGTIYGVEWHNEKFIFGKQGWYYWVGWDDWRYMSLHESELEAVSCSP